MAKKNAQKLQDWKIYSEIDDKDISKNLNNSPIWSKCDHEEYLNKEFNGYEYTIAFDGLRPIQVKNVKKYNR